MEVILFTETDALSFRERSGNYSWAIMILYKGLWMKVKSIIKLPGYAYSV